ncbi:MAG: DMT family transporter [Erythrobacter sp.]|uniref:DMT family transporter n=1 Tax=Erythrobacter sp. TaxID=1042 RepID=UPI0032993A13
MESVEAKEENVTGKPAGEVSRLRLALLLAALLGGNAALALGAWFVRMADTGPVAAGFWRLALAVPFLLLLARVNGQAVLSIGPKRIAIVVLAGLFFAADVAAWHIGIGMTRLGNAVLFANSGSIILMAWGFLSVGLFPKRSEWLAMASAVAGAGLLMGRSLEISQNTFYGDLLCLLAGMFYAGYLLILHDARRTVGGWSILFWTGLAGAPALLALSLSFVEVIWPTDWTAIVLLVVVSQLLGQGLFVYALGHFPPLIIGLSLLTQPAIAAMAGYFAFGEVLSALDVVGMLLLGSALVVAKAAQARS